MSITSGTWLFHENYLFKGPRPALSLDLNQMISTWTPPRHVFVVGRTTLSKLAEKRDRVDTVGAVSTLTAYNFESAKRFVCRDKSNAVLILT